MSISTYESGVLFTQAHRLVRQHIVDALAAHQITLTRWSILTTVMQAQDGIRLSSVAKQLHVKAPLVTMESKELVSNGLLTLLPHHTDSRAKLLVITPKGKKLLSSIETELAEQIAYLLGGLTPDEIQTFHKALTTIIRNS